MPGLHACWCKSAAVFDSFVVESPPLKFPKPLELDYCSLSVGALSLAGIVEVPGRLGVLLDLELTSVTESNTKTELAKLGLSELLWISPSALWQDISLLKRMGERHIPLLLSNLGERHLLLDSLGLASNSQTFSTDNLVSRQKDLPLILLSISESEEIFVDSDTNRLNRLFLECQSATKF